MKKILIGFAALAVLFVAALVAVPFLFKDEINATLKLEINKSLNAKVDYGDFDLSLIRSFPNFRFSIDDVSVVGINEFQGDTLAYFKKFHFTIDLLSVWNQETYKILAVGLTKPQVRAVVNKDGKANWDIVKESSEKSDDSSDSDFAFEIKKYSIENGYIVYDDQKEKTFVSINNLNFTGSGNAEKEVYDFETHTAIEAITYKSGAITYLNQVTIKGDNTISIDNGNQKFSFAKNEINVNDLGLLFDGYVQLADENIDLDVTFSSKNTSFKSILSLIPAVYKKDFADIKTAGTLKLAGAVKGSYNDENYPVFDLDLQIGNASFQYPDLPTSVNNINISANIKKAQGSLDKTVVNVQKLYADIGSEPIDAKIIVSTPISDPNVDLSVKGKVNLANVPKFYPIEDLKSISGLLTADLVFKGRQSDIDKKNFSAVKAEGNLEINGLVYDSKTTPMPVNVNRLKTTFSPQYITLETLSAKIGKSDFLASGSLENYVAYFFDQGDLRGKLNLSSGYFDVNEWLKTDSNSNPTSEEAPKVASETYFQVPENIDFLFGAKFGKILYDKLELTNAKGEVSVKDETISLKNLYAELLGGNTTIDASYSTQKSAVPKVTFAYNIKNFDFQKTYQFVGLAEKIAPIIQYVQGSFSSDLKGSGSLNEDMSVDYNSLQGEGKIAIPSAKVVNLPVLQKIAEVTKISALNNLSVNNAWTVLKFNDGKVAVEPTDIKLGNGYNINLKGLNGFDESIDYDVRLDVPSKELGNAASFLTGQIPSVGGVSVKAPETLNLFLKVGGTVKKPTVKLNKVSAGGSSIKDIITDTANDLKQKAEEEAKKQAEALKQKAEEEAQKIKSQAEQKAKEAADKAKQEADKAAQKAKDAADKAVKDAADKANDALKKGKLPW